MFLFNDIVSAAEVPIGI